MAIPSSLASALMLNYADLERRSLITEFYQKPTHPYATQKYTFPSSGTFTVHGTVTGRINYDVKNHYYYLESDKRDELKLVKDIIDLILRASA